MAAGTARSIEEAPLEMPLTRPGIALRSGPFLPTSVENDSRPVLSSRTPPNAPAAPAPISVMPPARPVTAAPTPGRPEAQASACAPACAALAPNVRMASPLAPNRSCSTSAEAARRWRAAS